jgi:hypothetical protein
MELWEKGLVYTVRLPTFRNTWKTIKMEGYNTSFTEYIDKILSASQKTMESHSFAT